MSIPNPNMNFNVLDQLTSNDMNKITANVDYLDTNTPTGAVMAFAGSSAPTNWLICDGTAILRSTYSLLFSVVGTTYGVGDGSTTFNIPNLKQRFPLGKGTSGTGSSLGSTGGSIDLLHNHTLSSAGQAQLIIPSSGNIQALNVTTASYTATRQVAGTGSTISVANTTGIGLAGTTDNNSTLNPPFLTLNFIIKY